MKTRDLNSVILKAIRNSNNRVDLWINLLNELHCTDLCEVGVFKGEFAQKLLNNIDDIRSYTLIDPWKNLSNWNKPANKSNVQFESIFSEAMSRVSPFKDKIVTIRKTTKDAKDEIKDDSLDFVYIDGDHTLRGITIDLNSMLRKVRKGGFIGGDDFTKSIWQHGAKFSPTEVFPYAIYFAEAHDLRIYTLPFDQFLIVNSGDGFQIVDHGNYMHLSPSQIYSRPGVIRELIRDVKGCLAAILPNWLKSLIKSIVKR